MKSPYLLLLTVCVAAAGHAQDITSQSINVAREAAAADTTATSVLQDAAPDVTLDAGEEGAFLTAQVGYRTYRPNNNLLTSVQLRAPTEGGKEEVGFLNLDGLTGGSTG